MRLSDKEKKIFRLITKRISRTLFPAFYNTTQVATNFVPLYKQQGILKQDDEEDFTQKQDSDAIYEQENDDEVYQEDFDIPGTEHSKDFFSVSSQNENTEKIEQILFEKNLKNSTDQHNSSNLELSFSGINLDQQFNQVLRNAIEEVDLQNSLESEWLIKDFNPSPEMTFLEYKKLCLFLIEKKLLEHDDETVATQMFQIYPLALEGHFANIPYIGCIKDPKDGTGQAINQSINQQSGQAKDYLGLVKLDECREALKEINKLRILEDIELVEAIPKLYETLFTELGSDPTQNTSLLQNYPLKRLITEQRMLLAQNSHGKALDALKNLEFFDKIQGQEFDPLAYIQEEICHQSVYLSLMGPQGLLRITIYNRLRRQLEGELMQRKGLDLMQMTLPMDFDKLLEVIQRVVPEVREKVLDWDRSVETFDPLLNQ